MRSAYDSFEGSHTDWLRLLLNRILYILLIAAILILIICWFLPLLKERQKQQLALQTLEQQLAQEKQIYRREQKKLLWIQRDPDYLELLARDKLDLKKPEEKIFRVEPSPGVK
ncbi:MAG TPA: septum formation initiator family protein [Chthoniobacterales bacterium]